MVDTASNNQTPLLNIENLSVQFHTLEGIHKAVRGVNIQVYPGESLGIVGESGSGKSVTSLAIMGLIPHPPGKITEGKLIFNDQDLLTFNDEQMRHVRGNEIAMIFQEPMTSLNPIHTCGKQIMESLRLHKGMDKKAAAARALELLTMVGIPIPEQRMNEYPHQLSGGMRQRVMIAIALACQPKLLIADEPTTALDVTIQAQILELMKNLKHKINSSIIMITHDLGVIAEMCERVVVMYAGQVVEDCAIEELFEHPYHPYAEGLLLSIPTIDDNNQRLYSIKGSVPNPFEMPAGCSFEPRCEYATEQCKTEAPELTEVEPRRFCRCWQWQTLKHKRDNQ